MPESRHRPAALSALGQVPSAAADPQPPQEAQPRAAAAAVVSDRYLPANYEVVLTVERPDGSAEHRFVTAIESFRARPPRARAVLFRNFH